ncbi:hypothetical protein Tco_1115832 [Tanacetum coccineum]
MLAIPHPFPIPHTTKTPSEALTKEAQLEDPRMKASAINRAFSASQWCGAPAVGGDDVDDVEMAASVVMVSAMGGWWRGDDDGVGDGGVGAMPVWWR